MCARAFLRACVCVCVFVCVRACARVCVCVCARDVIFYTFQAVVYNDDDTGSPRATRRAEHIHNAAPSTLRRIILIFERVRRPYVVTGRP